MANKVRLPRKGSAQVQFSSNPRSAMIVKPVPNVLFHQYSLEASLVPSRLPAAGLCFQNSKNDWWFLLGWRIVSTLFLREKRLLLLHSVIRLAIDDVINLLNCISLLINDIIRLIIGSLLGARPGPDFHEFHCFWSCVSASAPIMSS